MDSAVEKAKEHVRQFAALGVVGGEPASVRFARALLSSQSQVERMREALELIEVDLEAGDVPAKTRVAHALSRTKAWLAALPNSQE